jgi:hypothetical protein
MTAVDPQYPISVLSAVPGEYAIDAPVLEPTATGCMWRLRSLLAMGHSCARIARALHCPPSVIERLVAGKARHITPGLAQRIVGLWDQWWDKTPPIRSRGHASAATKARNRAERNNWPCAAGLDEDVLDADGYRPWCHWHPATGTGVASS